MDRALRIYLCLAFGITWGMGGIALLGGAYQPNAPFSAARVCHYVACFGPSLAGLIMVAHTDGRAGLGALARRTVPTLAHMPWYIAIPFGFVALNAIAARVFAPEFRSVVPSWDAMLVGLPLTLVRDTGPFGEEFGWRGFALPRLLQQTSPLRAAIVLGIVWWAWHLPTFFIRTLSQSTLSIPVFLANSVALSIIMTWLFQRTQGDLLLMLLVHAAANYCGWMGVPFSIEVGVEVACAVLIVLSGLLREWARAPRAHV